MAFPGTLKFARDTYVTLVTAALCHQGIPPWSPAGWCTAASTHSVWCLEMWQPSNEGSFNHVKAPACGSVCYPARLESVCTQLKLYS